MPVARPFVGLLYDPAVAGPPETVTAPPYDVISPADQARLHDLSPFNVVRLILGKGQPGDDGSSNRYTRAGSLLREWRQRGVLAAAPAPSLYLYEMRFLFAGSPRRIRGVIAEVELEAWGGSIVPHERTMPGPIEDRLRLIREVRANLSPVYAVFNGGSAPLRDALDAVAAGPPWAHVTDGGGVEHRMWITGADGDTLASDAAAALGDALRDEPLMIGDGHHRYAVALAYRDAMRAESGPGPWDSMMMLVVDAGTEDPPVLPIHRLVRDGGWGPARAPSTGSPTRVRDLAEVLAGVSDETLTYGVVRRDGDGVRHELARLRGEPPTVCALHSEVLADVPAGALQFLPDAAQAELAVRSDGAAHALLLPPTTVERVWNVVRSGSTLPQKSTYFWPKPLTGLVIRPFDP